MSIDYIPKHICEACGKQFVGGRKGKGDRGYMCYACRCSYQRGLDRTRKAISNGKRNRVLSAGKCAVCGATENLAVDHIIPLARGGDNSETNLQVLCKSCNSRKGARSV